MHRPWTLPRMPCCWCNRFRPLRELVSRGRAVLIGDRVILPGFLVCRRHPVFEERRCRCGSAFYHGGGRDFFDGRGRRLRWCPGCEALLGWEDGEETSP